MAITFGLKSSLELLGKGSLIQSSDVIKRHTEAILRSPDISGMCVNGTRTMFALE